MKQEKRWHRWHGGMIEGKGQRIDELLELLWIMKEDRKDDLKEFLKSSEDKDVKRLLEEMEDGGLVSVEGESIKFKSKGGKKAEMIIRRHRLAERLFADLFEFEIKQAHADACAFEHILSPEVTDSVCTFLGHPPICPDGRPIPRGECCKKFQIEIKPLVQSLTSLQPGKDGRIVFITPRYHARLDKLGSLGIVPGSIVRVHQRKPSYVLKIGETEIALDEEIAKEIYVREV
ncbi:MAG: metal-dependent transcriptional regulator [Nitrospirae bacterium]|nr:metal-dependent transcriptional regulator [Nitrospirota bacterium]